jgi:hypothetical protein
MSRVAISLTKENYDRLAQLARQERRVPPEQAAYLLDALLEQLAKRGWIRASEIDRFLRAEEAAAARALHEGEESNEL